MKTNDETNLHVQEFHSKISKAVKKSTKIPIIVRIINKSTKIPRIAKKEYFLSTKIKFFCSSKRVGSF